jgi:nicotinamide riboside transporter PnuC
MLYVADLGKGVASMCAGSLFITYTIKTFGALVFAIIMTTRQFLSILLSSMFFGSPLTLGQWYACSGHPQRHVQQHAPGYTFVLPTVSIVTPIKQLQKNGCIHGVSCS